MCKIHQWLCKEVDMKLLRKKAVDKISIFVWDHESDIHPSEITLGATDLLPFDAIAVLLFILQCFRGNT